MSDCRDRWLVVTLQNDALISKSVEKSHDGCDHMLDHALQPDTAVRMSVSLSTACKMVTVELTSVLF